MIIARVIGSAVATIKDSNLRGLKLLVVQEATPSDELTGQAFVAGVAVEIVDELAVQRLPERRVLVGRRDGRGLRLGWRGRAGR